MAASQQKQVETPQPSRFLPLGFDGWQKPLPGGRNVKRNAKVHFDLRYQCRFDGPDDRDARDGDARRDDDALPRAYAERRCVRIEVHRLLSKIVWRQISSLNKCSKNALIAIVNV
jgi:hypothetical protein